MKCEHDTVNTLGSCIHNLLTRILYTWMTHIICSFRNMAQRQIPENLDHQLRSIIKERPLESWHVEKKTSGELELRISFGSNINAPNKKDGQGTYVEDTQKIRNSYPYLEVQGNKKQVCRSSYWICRKCDG